jgi:hypothetical protein
MKTQLQVMTIICIGAFLWSCGSAAAEQANWKVLQQSTYGDTWSYDTASVKNTGSNTITVRTRTQSSAHLYEIDCKNKKARILEGVGADGSSWFNIVGGEELLYNAVCP